MQFVCKRQRLSEILSVLGDVIPARSAKAVLQNIYVQPIPEQAKIVLCATDLEIDLRYQFEVEGLAKGDTESILLPAQRLISLIRDDRSDEITFTISGQIAKIKTEFGMFHLTGSASDDFPAQPETKKENQVQIPGNDLEEALQKTLISVARGDARYTLNGILINIDENIAEFVSTDTHRLSRVIKKIKNPEKVKSEGIVISRGIATLSKLAANREFITLQLTDKSLIAETPDATLSVRLVEGQFPRYREVIPTKLEKRFTVDRENFLWQVRLVGNFANDETHAIALEFKDEDHLIIRGKGPASASADQTIDADIRGGEFLIKFNYVYLLDYFKGINDEKATLQLNNATAAARADSGDFTYVIMPVQD